MKCSHTPFECLHKSESSFKYSHMYTLSATVGRAVTEAHIQLKRERGREQEAVMQEYEQREKDLL